MNRLMLFLLLVVNGTSVKALADAKEGQLLVRTTPWTTVHVDGKRLGSTPRIETLPAGPHTLQLVNTDQGINETRKISITAGQTLKLDLKLGK